MKLNEYTESERGKAKELAEKLGVSASRMSQIIADSSSTIPSQCVNIERETGMAVRRWDLRPADWFLIWPELIGADGAPSIPKARAKQAA